MLRRKPATTALLDDIDRTLLAGVDAGLSWEALIHSASCDADEATLRIMRMIQQGQLEGRPGEPSAPPVAPSAPQAAETTARTVPPRASVSANFSHTAITKAASSAVRPVPPQTERAPSMPAPTASSSMPPGRTMPPKASAAGEALLRELAMRRTGTSYPPARPSTPPASTPPGRPSGYYSVQPGSADRAQSSVPPQRSERPLEAPRAASSLPPGRYSVQPDAERGSPSLAPSPPVSPAESPLLALIERLSAGHESERWCAARLRESIELENTGRAEQAIATLQAVMARLTDPRIRLERDRIQSRLLKANAGAIRARALSEERAAKHKEAAESWRKVLEASPDDAEAAVHAATCHMEIGDIKQAGLYARRAVELAPQSVTAHRLLLRFFKKTGMEHNANRERDILRKLGKGG